MQFAYWHGYFFNYCKVVDLGGRKLIAYWSVRENKWHLGQLVIHAGAGVSIWEEHYSNQQKVRKKAVEPTGAPYGSNCSQIEPESA